MTPEEYVQRCLATKSEQFHAPKHDNSFSSSGSPNLLTIDVAHAILGISTEAGELLDLVKKAMFYGRPVDYVNADEEVGDVLWYVSIYCAARGKRIEDLMALNIAKLAKRYPDKFDAFLANNRDLAGEREVLEQRT